MTQIAPEYPQVDLRPPSQVMRLERMGSFFPTRLSFMRSLIRQLNAETAQVTRPLWDINEGGYGRAVYSVDLGGFTYSLVAFSNPLDPGNVVDNTVVFAEFGGQKLAARIQVAANRRTLTLFYDEPLPPSARVRVTVVGDQLLDASGRPVDADGDGVPGGSATIDFDTLTLTLVEGTSICGRVFASELA